jgi:hypothetical protein
MLKQTDVYFLTDRSLMLWTVRLDKLESSVKELNMKDIRTIRSAVKFDHATRIRWSPDSKALLTIRATNNDVEIYRLNKKEGGALPTVTPTGTLPKVIRRLRFIHFSSLISWNYCSIAKLI